MKFTPDQSVYLFKSFVEVCVCLGQVPKVPTRIVKSGNTYIEGSKQRMSLKKCKNSQRGVWGLIVGLGDRKYYLLNFKKREKEMESPHHDRKLKACVLWACDIKIKLRNQRLESKVDFLNKCLYFYIWVTPTFLFFNRTPLPSSFFLKASKD